LNVRAKARTYLRSNGRGNGNCKNKGNGKSEGNCKNKGNCKSRDQYRGLSATRLRAPVEMTDLVGEKRSLRSGGADDA
jgi:hypothetical protein